VTTGGSRIRFPTAAVALIRFDATGWTGIASGSGELKWLVTPKLIGEVL
jgi:hypothetical protein